MESGEASLKFVDNYYNIDLSERNTSESKWFLSWLKNLKGNEILSLGCGPNLLDDVIFFKTVPQKVVGIDINQSNIDFINKSRHPEIQKCRDLLASKHVQVELIVGNIFEQREDFIGRFDAVYAMGVVGMYKKQEFQHLLQIIMRYLKPNGMFLDIDWTDCRLSRTSLEERKRVNWYDTHGPSISTIGTLLNQSGFTIKRHGVYSVPNPQEYGWGKIYAYLCFKT